jgi:hypothetical protein
MNRTLLLLALLALCSRSRSDVRRISVGDIEAVVAEGFRGPVVVTGYFLFDPEGDALFSDPTVVDREEPVRSGPGIFTERNPFRTDGGTCVLRVIRRVAFRRIKGGLTSKRSTLFDRACGRVLRM